MNWISVKNRLPKKWEYVAVYLESADRVYTARLDDHHKDFCSFFMNCEQSSLNCGSHTFSDGEVTHWMPLPPAPKTLLVDWATKCNPPQEIEHCDRCDEMEMELQDEK